jgi:hypothetical protein
MLSKYNTVFYLLAVRLHKSLTNGVFITIRALEHTHTHTHTPSLSSFLSQKTRLRLRFLYVSTLLLTKSEFMW